LVYTVAAVQSAANLLISLNKSLKFNSQISVLINENIAMVLKSIDLSLHIGVGALQVLIREAKVILFTLGNVKLLFCVTASALQFHKLSSELLVAHALSLEFVLFLLQLLRFLDFVPLTHLELMSFSLLFVELRDLLQ